jgi:hypothetical protein
MPNMQVAGTALICAVRFGHTGCARLLLENGADKESKGSVRMVDGILANLSGSSLRRPQCFQIPILISLKALILCFVFSSSWHFVDMGSVMNPVFLMLISCYVLHPILIYFISDSPFVSRTCS